MNEEHVLAFMSSLNDLREHLVNYNVLDMSDIKTLPEIKLFLPLITRNDKLNKSINACIDLIKDTMNVLKEYELRPPCDVCGFKGGLKYHEAFQHFNFQKLRKD